MCGDLYRMSEQLDTCWESDSHDQWEMILSIVNFPIVFGVIMMYMYQIIHTILSLKNLRELKGTMVIT